MKSRKPGTPSRRGFLARLAAIGTVLGGVVPELRASMLMGTPIAPAPATPLPPAASAMLHSLAVADAEVKMLLASAGPGASVMPPERTYDMGGQGQGIALPVKNSSGIVTAYILYGSGSVPGVSSQADSPAIKLMLKENGTATIAHNGATYPTPPEAADNVSFLYASLFTDKFIEEKLAAAVNNQAFAQKKQTPTQKAAAAAAVCRDQFDACQRALLKMEKMAFWGAVACIACMASVALSAGLSLLACTAACGVSGAWINSWTKQLEVCTRRLERCLAGINI
jgi:hypothetical protein